jgi:transposase InsO family protein
VELIVAAREKHPTWGPKKLKKELEEKLKRPFPAVSTMGDILARKGLVVRRKLRPRHRRAWPSGLREATAANEIWCIDYKGQFRLGDRSLCYPLTITDQVSRYILGCEGMAAICEEAAQEVCEEVFRANGLPVVMRSDNGVPFATTGLAGLSKLSAYWMRLGIVLERIRPAHPEENGRHERMHLTLKQETARPARKNLLQQQERFDEFVAEFNHERPHEAIDMKRPAEIHERSPRLYPTTLPEPTYPEHDDVVRVHRDGLIQFSRRKCYLAAALAGQPVGIREEGDGRWLVTFMDLDLGHVGSDNKLNPLASSTPPEAT